MMPFWVYLVIIGIVVSGYMTLYTSKKEEEMDHEFIEREGEVYIERMLAEQERRAIEKDDHSVLL